ncbi:unnamed protein product [Zymoseptoria tritici ST99CH_1A5]|uniref:Uncharacterized protein n=3 Tax=Zymoseptoria tritici TaxID=1047171 RepID=A0A1X7RMS6_ZYMT9|nr:unnamed protein product [Zymoseptoria tritici ST99CH_3D7]SMR48564.1 unnamed protein product [Zymoseptoria tritici ST99CH_1E4]SMR49745.1 unnamed protein product [Zymoseptoria tritici ST99CH_3D1]SMY22443.1 unnamed protein product [Zymoseptoria tritici ST99CH_1A5]
MSLADQETMTDQETTEEEGEGLCLCFPCILSYLGGYVYPVSERQFYPQLQQKGFSPQEQWAIAEEWYWIAFERETAVHEYLRGIVNFRDGHWWRPPPAPMLMQDPSTVSTPASSTSTSSGSGASG